MISTTPISEEELMLKLKFSTVDELEYLKSCYYGPNKVLLREKVFGHMSDKFQRLITDELSLRAIEDSILKD